MWAQNQYWVLGGQGSIDSFMMELIVSYAWYIVNGEKLQTRGWCSGVCRWLGADASTSSTATRKMHRGVVAAPEVAINFWHCASAVCHISLLTFREKGTHTSPSMRSFNLAHDDLESNTETQYMFKDRYAPNELNKPSRYPPAPAASAKCTARINESHTT